MRSPILVTAVGDPDAIVPRPRDIDAWLSAFVRTCGYTRPIHGQWRVTWQGNGFVWEKIA